MIFVCDQVRLWRGHHVVLTRSETTVQTKPKIKYKSNLTKTNKFKQKQHYFTAKLSVLKHPNNCNLPLPDKSTN